jgi:hypothetical protein
MEKLSIYWILKKKSLKFFLKDIQKQSTLISKNKLELKAKYLNIAETAYYVH